MPLSRRPLEYRAMEFLLSSVLNASISDGPDHAFLLRAVTALAGERAPCLPALQRIASTLLPSCDLVRYRLDLSRSVGVGSGSEQCDASGKSDRLSCAAPHPQLDGDSCSVETPPAR